VLFKWYGELNFWHYNLLFYSLYI